MKRQSIASGLLVATFLVATVCGSALYATEPLDQARLAFSNALGEPALIGANADHELALTRYRPIAAFNASDVDANKLRLGFDLFHERRLSADNTIGCNSCHSGMFGGTDGRKVSIGAYGATGHLNAPTTFNAAMNFRQFWDGRAVTLSEQALGPIENPIEMAHDLSAVVQMLENDAGYANDFASVYPDGITTHNIGDALAYFQTMNFTRATTPFVRHLNGEDGQLSEQALRGWQRFDEIGCASCHNGINLGGNSYQQLGAAASYFVEHRVANDNDNGLINRSLRETDIHVFKVPTLHGIAETAPYFHDGSIDTLEAAIEEMGEHQLGRLLNQQEVDDIAAFLQSLGGRGMGMMMGNMGMGRGQGMREGQGMRMRQGQGMREGQGMRMRQGERQNMRQGMRQRQDSVEAAPASTQPFAQQESHIKAYASAIAATEFAQNKLLAEMTRIQSGDVAHYDFLQFEHLELIRHARALHHPPAILNEAERVRLTSLAEQLLAQTNALEWVIADFLRAIAMIEIMQTHIDDPVQDNPVAGLGDPAARLSSYQQTVRDMLSAMRASQVTDTSKKLGNLFAAAQ